MTWTGPDEGELNDALEWVGQLPIPPHKWPYGPPDVHDSCCTLAEGGRFCDCEASDSGPEVSGLW
jgi:hypothetical protein